MNNKQLRDQNAEVSNNQMPGSGSLPSGDSATVNLAAPEHAGSSPTETPKASGWNAEHGHLEVAPDPASDLAPEPREDDSWQKLKEEHPAGEVPIPPISSQTPPPEEATPPSLQTPYNSPLGTLGTELSRPRVGFVPVLEKTDAEQPPEPPPTPPPPPPANPAVTSSGGSRLPISLGWIVFLVFIFGALAGYGAVKSRVLGEQLKTDLEALETKVQTEVHEITRTVTNVKETVTTLESVIPIPGPPGEPGERGPRGLTGASGDPCAACVFLQSTYPGVQQAGNFNISGRALLGDLPPTIADEIKLLVIRNDDHTRVAVQNNSSTMARFPGYQATNYAGSTAGYPIYKFENAAGSVGGPSALPGVATVGALLWGAHDGTTFRDVAQIMATLGSNFGSGDLESVLRFLTRDGTAGMQERVRIDNLGNVGVGTVSPIATEGRTVHIYNDLNDGTVTSNASLVVQSANRNSTINIVAPTTGVSTINFRNTTASTQTNQATLSYSHTTKGISLGLTSDSSLVNPAIVDLNTGNLASSANLSVGTASTADTDLNSATLMLHKQRVGTDAMGMIGVRNADTTSAAQSLMQFWVRNASGNNFVNPLTLDGSGTALFKNATDSATAFQIQNAAGNVSLFLVDATNLTITLGAPSATPVLLVLGNKNTAGDPTCDASKNGGIYYNSSSHQVRGCVNGAWNTIGGDNVVTSVPTINLYDGRRISLRAGSSPYEIINLVYDATKAKWVSPIERVSPNLFRAGSNASFNHNGVWGNLFSNGVTPEVITGNYHTLYSAGLRLEARLIAQVQINGGVACQFRPVYQLWTENSNGARTTFTGTSTGNTPATNGTYFARNDWEVVATNPSAADDILMVDFEAQNAGAPSANNYIFNLTVELRWVSA